MNRSEISEVDVLDSLLPKYEADGFEVYIHPSPSILPSFMRSYRPDAIALRSDKKVAIEIVRSGAGQESKLESLQSLFAPHSEWELRVVYMAPRTTLQPIAASGRAAIVSSIQRVSELKRAGHELPALIMAWATLEAVGRALLPERFSKPQTPARLVEVLASDGYLTPSEADALRAVIQLRNAAVHGAVDATVDDEQIDQFLKTLGTLAGYITEGGNA